MNRKSLLLVIAVLSFFVSSAHAASHPLEGRYTGTALIGVEDPDRWVVDVMFVPFGKQYRMKGKLYIRSYEHRKTLKSKMSAVFDPSSNSVWGYVKGKSPISLTGRFDCAKKKFLLSLNGIEILAKRKGGAPRKPFAPCDQKPTPTPTTGPTINFRISGVYAPSSIKLNGVRQEATIYYVARPGPVFPLTATITFTGCPAWVFSDCGALTMQFDTVPADRKLHFTNALGCKSSSLDHQFRIDFEVVLRDSAGKRTATWNDSFQCVP